MERLEIKYSINVMSAMVGMARYNFVNKTVSRNNLKVLDFGCGSGYGTKILKEKLNNVTSFDTYPDGYGKPENITIVDDIEALMKEKFEVITCFEVIEHMGKDDQHKLMDKLKEMLTPNGVLFISTVKKIDPPPTLNRQLEHIRELTYEEFLNFCESRFKNVFTFGQIDQIISTFHKDNHYHFIFICTAKK